MKFKIKSYELKNILNATSRAVNPRPSIPSLQGLYLSLKDNLFTVVGSDLDVLIKGVLKVEEEIEGECLVNARVATEIARKLPTGDVLISDTGSDLRLEINSLNFSLRKLDEKQYPKDLVEGTVFSENPVTLEKEEFFTAINQVGVASAQEGGKPVLTGVLFDNTENKTNLVSTDSYRLALKELSNFPLENIGVVSKKALGEVVRLFEEVEEDVRIVANEREVCFNDDSFSVSLRKIEGEYPKYKDLFPKETLFSIELEKEEILEALDRSLVVAEGYIPVALSFTNNSLKITSKNKEVGGGEEEVSCVVLGVDVKEVDKFTMSFNPTYLMEGITATSGSKVYLRFSGNQKPLLIQGELDEYKHLLMPVKN